MQILKALSTARIGNEILAVGLESLLLHEGEAPTGLGTEEIEALLDDDKSQLQQLKKALAEQNKVLAWDFGANNELFELHKKCFSLASGVFNYEICPFGKVISPSSVNYI